MPNWLLEDGPQNGVGNVVNLPLFWDDLRNAHNRHDYHAAITTPTAATIVPPEG